VGIRDHDKLETRSEFLRYFTACLATENTAVAAASGHRDRALSALAEEVKSAVGSFEVIDYGCGDGRLVDAFAGLQTEALRRMTYIGVDVDEAYLVKTAQHAIRTGFVDRIERFHVLLDEWFMLKPAEAELIFLIHVLHEIVSSGIMPVLKSLLLKLRRNGKLVIHELGDMAKFPEKDFEVWSAREFESLFGALRTEDFKVEVISSTSTRGYPLVTAIIRKLTDDVVIPNELDDKIYLEVLRSKARRLYLALRECEEGEGDRAWEYAYLTTAYSNLSRRILEVEIKEAAWAGKEIACFKCQGGVRKVERRFATDKLGLTDPDVVIFTTRCGGCGDVQEIEKQSLDRDLEYLQEEIWRAYGRPLRMGGGAIRFPANWKRTDYVQARVELSKPIIEEARRNT